MKRIFLLLMLNGIWFTQVYSQKFDTDTLLLHGSPDHGINLVFLGDGYTANEQDKFIKDAQKVLDYMFTISPFQSYKNYFNAFAIKVISNESGAIHPNTASDCNSANVPVSNPDTYLQCSFDVNDIHRLIVPKNTVRIIQVLATNFPFYDQVIIISNTPHYGGSGGSFATLTTNSRSPEVAVHEIGHSFANLGDEYWAGDSYARERPNMTQETNPTIVKWRNWMNENGIGIYKHGTSGVSANWYRPHQNCKMRTLNVPFCSVCSETIIERIHTMTNPIISYHPVGNKVIAEDSLLTFRLTQLMKPEPNTLNVQWTLNDVPIEQPFDSLTVDRDDMEIGTNYVAVTVVDTVALVRVDGHNKKHFSTVVWEIEKKDISSVEVFSSENNIEFAIFPNPATAYLNIELSSKQPLEQVFMDIYTIEGQFIQSVEQAIRISDRYESSVNISDLTSGNYIFRMRSKGIQQSLPFQKY